VNERKSKDEYGRTIRLIFIVSLVFFSLFSFILWKIDNSRAERVRMAALDKLMPNFEWVLGPLRGLSSISEGIGSYSNLVKENRELRLKLQKMRDWREAAIRLEEENSQLLDLNNVRVNPSLKYITGLVLSDSGSSFRRSLLLNIGAFDGINDGWAVVDSSGLVGRIFGVGEKLSRVVLIIDSSSRIPVKIEPSGKKALLVGDNSLRPPIEIVENKEMIRSGDRVVTSGDGNVFPSDVLVGHVIRDADQRLRVKLVANYGRLKFLKVIKTHTVDPSDILGEVITNTVTD